MSDIFISYASANRDRAKMVADALAARGLSVWWDRAIPPGRQFDEVIEEALDAAKCVVVLWSQASTASTWVKTEAAEAMRRKALIPAIIEDVKIPLEFRRLQAADLSQWQGDGADPQFMHFVESIEAELKRGGQQSTGESAAANEAAAERQKPGEAPRPPSQALNKPRSTPSLRLSPAVIGALVAALVLVLGAGLYYERTASIAAAEKAAEEKTSQALAERAREEAARAAAQTKTAEARADKRATADERAAPRPKQQGVPASGVMNLEWRDHALGYSGSLAWSPASAVLRVTVVDLNTGMRIGNYNVPALISQQGPAEYVVSGDFAVPGDSATPGPHTHSARLRIRAQPDGTLRFMQNCPRPGQCY